MRVGGFPGGRACTLAPLYTRNAHSTQGRLHACRVDYTPAHVLHRCGTTAHTHVCRCTHTVYVSRYIHTLHACKPAFVIPSPP